MVGSSENKREAESELTAREERRERFEARSLPDPARKRYIDSWKEVQAQFVDDPRGAVGSADTLLQLVMRERGYPVDDFEQRAADISVDYPDVVENYRSGHRLWEANKQDGASTEDLRLRCAIAAHCSRSSWSPRGEKAARAVHPRGVGASPRVPYTHRGGPVAQSVEQGTFNPKVAGSIPARPITDIAQTEMRDEPGGRQDLRAADHAQLFD